MSFNIPIATPPNIPGYKNLNTARIQTLRTDNIIGNYSSWKEHARLATTVNITTLEGLLTVDGSLTVDGDRILVKDQTNAVDNGIYAASAGPWPRSSDLEVGQDASGTTVLISEGSVNNDKFFFCTNAVGDGIVGTDSLVFTEITGAAGGAAGPNNSVQYNSGGSLEGSSTFTFDGSNTITLGTEGADSFLKTPTATTSGTSGGLLGLVAGNGLGSGKGGDVSVSSGTSPENVSGSIGFFGADDASTGSSGLFGNGALLLLSGDSNSNTGSAPGKIIIQSGDSSSNLNGADVLIQSGDSTGVSGNGGDIDLETGASTSGNGGDLTLTAGTGTGTDGQISLVQNGNTFLWPTTTPTTNEFLQVTNGSSPFTLDWVSSPPGASGPDNSIQYNSGSSTFAGSSTLAFNGSNSITFGTEAATSTLQAPGATTADTVGGALFLSAGTGNGTGIGGDITLSSGIGATNAGGTTNVTSGGSFSGDSGDILIGSGNINIGFGNSGDVSVFSGNGRATGDVYIYSSDSGNASTGSININSGSNASTIGDINISTGNSVSGTGGKLNLLTGRGGNGGNGGDIDIIPGTGGTGVLGTGEGGAINLTSGDGGASGGNSGLVTVKSGTSSALRGGVMVGGDSADLLGFYGTDPIAKQTLASDTLANLLIALRALGVIV